MVGNQLGRKRRQFSPVCHEQAYLLLGKRNKEDNRESHPEEDW